MIISAYSLPCFSSAILVISFTQISSDFCVQPANCRWCCWFVIVRLYPGHPLPKGKPHIDLLLQEHGERNETMCIVLFSCGLASVASRQESGAQWCTGSWMMCVGYLAALVGIFQSIILSLLRLDGNLHVNQDALRAIRAKEDFWWLFFFLFSLRIEPQTSYARACPLIPGNEWL